MSASKIYDSASFIKQETNCVSYYQDSAYTVLHRTDGPAVIRTEGYGPTTAWHKGQEEWWQNGIRHRVDGPAIVRADGYEQWWVDGKEHRVDGPAEIHPGVSELWWQNGMLHREDGPAIVFKDSPKRSWWVYDVSHRIDGPAAIFEDGHEDWRLFGLSSFEDEVRCFRERIVAEFGVDGFHLVPFDVLRTVFLTSRDPEVIKKTKPYHQGPFLL